MLFLPSQPIFSPLTHHRTWGMQEWAAGDKEGVPHPPPQFLDSHEWALLGCQPWWGASAGSRRSRNHVLSHTLTVAAWMEKYLRGETTVQRYGPLRNRKAERSRQKQKWRTMEVRKRKTIYTSIAPHGPQRTFMNTTSLYPLDNSSRLASQVLRGIPILQMRN